MAAVAAGLCPLALGSQTIGSVARHAAFCGVVGVKPSYDRISARGVFPAASSVDTVGYFTQDVGGAQLASGVLVAGWSGDIPSRRCRIGVVEGPYLEQATADGKRAFRAHIERLEAAGFDVCSVDPFANIEAINERHNRVIVTHGTSAIEEDAYFADLVLDLEIPVVFVGAMRPADAPTADGPSNMLSAARLIADGAFQLTDRPSGVYVVLNETVYAARDVTKADTWALEAFSAGSAGPIARFSDE